MINWAFVFMIWLALYFGALALRQYRSAELRQSELARALQLAELRLLKSQLNPHFLFNALNTVRSLIADDPPRAQDAVTRLANTLRYTLTSAQDELVTLEQELEIVGGLSRASSRCGSRIDCASTATSPPTRAAYAYRSCCCRPSSRTPSSTESPSCRREASSGSRRPARRRADARSREPAPVDALRAKRPEGIGLRNAAERLAPAVWRACQPRRRSVSSRRWRRYGFAFRHGA